MIILHVSHFKRNIYLDNCSQNSFRECNTPLLFHSACTPLPEFCVFYNFTILQSDTITHDYLRPAIIYLSLLHNHLCPLLSSGAGSDSNAEASVLGGKNGSLAVYQKIS